MALTALYWEGQPLQTVMNFAFLRKLKSAWLRRPAPKPQNKNLPTPVPKERKRIAFITDREVSKTIEGFVRENGLPHWYLIKDSACRIAEEIKLNNSVSFIEPKQTQQDHNIAETKSSTTKPSLFVINDPVESFIFLTDENIAAFTAAAGRVGMSLEEYLGYTAAYIAEFVRPPDVAPIKKVRGFWRGKAS